MSLFSRLSANRSTQLFILCIVAMAGMYARAELAPLQESVKASLALSDAQIALLQGPALAIPLLICAVPLGFLVDRYGRNRLLVIATFINILATVVGGLTHRFETLLLSRCAIGACSPVTIIAACSLISDSYPVNRRGRATTVIVLGAVAGTATGFALGGQLLALSQGVAGNWNQVMMWTAAILAPVLPLSMFLREAPRQERADKTPSIRSMYEQFRRHGPVIGVLVVGMGMVNLADGATLVWAAPTLHRSFGLSAKSIGTIMGVAIFFSGVIGPLLGGPLTDFCQRSGGAKRAVTLLGLLALLSAPCSLFGAMSQIHIAVVALLLFLTIGTAIGVIVSALTISVLPNEVRGQSMTLQSGLAAAFGFGVAPLAVTWISGELGGPASIGQALAIVCASASVIGALIFGCSRGMFRYAPEGAIGQLAGSRRAGGRPIEAGTGEKAV